MVLGDDRAVSGEWLGTSLEVLRAHSEFVCGAFEQPWNGGVVVFWINVGYRWHPAATVSQVTFLDHVATEKGMFAL